MPLQESHINIINNFEKMPTFQLSNNTNMNNNSYSKKKYNNGKDFKINSNVLNYVTRSKNAYNYNFIYKD